MIIGPSHPKRAATRSKHRGEGTTLTGVSARPRVLLVCVLAVVVVMTAGGIALVSPATAQDTVDEARDAVEAARAEVDDARAALEDAQREANRTATELFDAVAESESIDVELAELGKRLDDAQAQRDALAASVRSVMIDQYVEDQRGTDVLDDPDINRTARARALSRLVAESSLDVLDAYRGARSELLDLEADLAERRRRHQEVVAGLDEARAVADARLADLAAEQERLDARLDELTELEAKLVAEEEARRAEEERQRQEEARRLAAEEEARRQATQPTPTPVPDTPPATATPDSGTSPQPTVAPTPSPGVPDGTPPSSTTGWVCPVAGPTSFIDSWGAPRSYGRWHKGTDMMAAHGTPVVAVVDGNVEHRDNGIGGLSAHLQAGDGTYFYYTHLSGYENVGAGFVVQGTVIGYVGQTGNATVDHLHFEHHPGGRGSPVNPYPTLIASC